MTMPALGSFAQAVYDQLEPMQYAEAELDYPLAKYIAALATGFQPVDDLVRDSDDGPGWSQLVDPDRCPAYALPWLAQMAGAILLRGSSEAQQRARINDNPARKRGTVPAIVSAAQETLTGTKAVIVVERYGGNAYAIQVLTIGSETPSTTVTQAAIVAAKPAGLTLTYATTTGADYSYLESLHGTYTTTEGAYVDYSDMVTP